MSKIAIVTDTDASLHPDLAARYGIYQVPITVHFGEQVLETWVDIDDIGLFERIEREGRLPTTAAPAPGKFAAAYQAAFTAGADEVICFTVSGEVSATYGAALAAKELASGPVEVVDTRSLAIGQGFIVLAAAEAAQQGASRPEILRLADSVRARTHLYAALGTLKYLAMSGRVGHLAAGMASILNIKPILTIQNGKLEMLEKVRTRNKAWGRAIELAGEKIAGGPVERMAIVHVAAPEQAGAFEQQLRASLPCPDEILHTELSAGLSVHSGAGMVGVSFVTAG
ncbi:MAG: DegV family protein [Anaerolineales bacterium]|nr:DegV family protein [Anaerolineales bacterium]